MHNPALYDRSNTLQIRDACVWIPNLIEQMNWTKSERVLDFGCGNGFITTQVLKPCIKNEGVENLEMIAVDIVQKNVNFAVEKYATPGVQFAVFDVLDPDSKLPVEKFNKIFSFHVLHWIGDLESVFCRFYNLLENDGEIGFYFNCKGYFFSVYAILSRLPKFAKYHSDADFFIPVTNYTDNPKEIMEEILKLAGFALKSCKVIKTEFVYPNMEAFLDASIAMNPFVHRIPDDLRSEYISEVGRIYKDFLKPSPTPEHPDGVILEVTNILAVAKKVK